MRSQTSIGVWALAALLLMSGCASREQAQAPATATDRDFRQLMEAGRSLLVDYGDAADARQLFAQALDRAYEMNDAAAIATASYSEAATLARLRRTDEALAVLAQPGVELPPDPQGRRSLLAAAVHLQREDADAAERALDEAEALLESGADRASQRALIALARGRVGLLRGEASAARSAIETTAGAGSPAVRARRQRVIGMLAEREGRAAEAVRAFDAEAEAARRGKNWYGAAEATARAASASVAAE
ncbi:MAG: hypothetical protein GVY24_07570, partial [Planctomycetes bacterium]|nr:hypothetical protein [Planctomycetota bacterium]